MRITAIKYFNMMASFLFTTNASRFSIGRMRPTPYIHKNARGITGNPSYSHRKSARWNKGTGPLGNSVLSFCLQVKTTRTGRRLLDSQQLAGNRDSALSPEIRLLFFKVEREQMFLVCRGGAGYVAVGRHPTRRGCLDLGDASRPRFGCRVLSRKACRLASHSL